MFDLEKIMIWLGRAVRLLPILPLFVLATSCGDFFVSESSLQSVTVTPSAVILKVGDTPADTYKLSSSSTTVGGTAADDTAAATWSSNNPNVTVAAGVITAGTSATTAIITAKDGGVTSNACNVLTYIVSNPANLFVTAPTNLSTTGAAPGSYNFRAFLGPDTSFPEVTNFVTWSSSATTAATVNATTGVVTVLSLATPTAVTITATANVGASAPATQSIITGTLQFTAD
jgi:hypothetical protein